MSLSATLLSTVPWFFGAFMASNVTDSGGFTQNPIKAAELLTCKCLFAPNKKYSVVTIRAEFVSLCRFLSLQHGYSVR